METPAPPTKYDAIPGHVVRWSRKQPDDRDALPGERSAREKTSSRERMFGGLAEHYYYQFGGQESDQRSEPAVDRHPLGEKNWAQAWNSLTDLLGKPETGIPCWADTMRQMKSEGVRCCLGLCNLCLQFLFELPSNTAKTSPGPGT